LSHDILESLRYIPHGGMHMCTTEIKLNLGSVMAPKKTDNPKKRTADAGAKRFRVCIIFEHQVGQ